jgi:hypothetical protein
MASDQDRASTGSDRLAKSVGPFDIEESQGAGIVRSVEKIVTCEKTERTRAELAGEFACVPPAVKDVTGAGQRLDEILLARRPEPDRDSSKPTQHRVGALGTEQPQ